MSSLIPMSSLPSDSLFYPGETSGAASDPVFRNDPVTRLLSPLITNRVIIPHPLHLPTIFAISCDFRTPT